MVPLRLQLCSFLNEEDEIKPLYSSIGIVSIWWLDVPGMWEAKLCTLNSS